MIDLDFVACGYLLSPDSTQFRHVPQLDRIAQDTQRAGIAVAWGIPRNGRRACAYLWRRLIVLHPLLYYSEGYTLREAWSHELGHFLVGRNEDRVQAWQFRCYGDLILPLAIAC